AVATTSNKPKYPTRLVTYDAEEAGEPRLIRYSDLTDSVIDLVLAQGKEEECQARQEKQRKRQVRKKDEHDEGECKKEEEDCQMEEKCQVKEKCRKRRQTKCKATKKKIKKECKPKKNACMLDLVDSAKTADPAAEWRRELKWAQLNAMLTSSFEALCPGEQLSEARLKLLELYARRLHKRFVERQGKGTNPVPNQFREWESLQPMQKFRYYWEALTQQELQPTPYANFRQVFLRRYRRTYGDTRNLWSKVFRCWRMQKCSEQLPYILNALLYQISIGTVDAYDSCSIRKLINLWSRQ
ncbi:hypothetical protein KR044_008328, partial [Drosophila immigrans]